ncbi:TraM recognition domain-containing protein [Cysteiniphilum sp. JM-1]|uniref:TraM recognition domain-containing protein n=1 Tax=Cysteiniphilum sp. JM-1 TaxID=2610891 RepID=UPI0029622E01|nr:TraM recognition domain-containing protein [Cysteiniphilum sp. JM-1]
MIANIRGISKKSELNNNFLIRDTRGQFAQTIDLVKTPLAVIFLSICLVVTNFFFPVWFDLCLLGLLSLLSINLSINKKIPFKKPIFSKELDPNNPNPGSIKPGKSNGIFHIGNDRDTNSELWFNNNDMRTHMLIFGSTGSGKTESLLSISHNALAQNSGLIYVDGKGDNSLYAKMYSMAKSMGREDDVLVVNFMTGGTDIIGKQSNKLSNTLNPFSTGSSSMLTQLIVSMMGGSKAGGDGDMWKGRAISFVEALMKCLVYLRDKDYLLLDAGTIRRYLVLDVVEDLIYSRKFIDPFGEVIELDHDLPFEVTDPLKNYLFTLPGFQAANVGKQSDKTYEQHGYISMQLTRIFGSLADVYGHIMRSNLAEVDFTDVILNRRILVVLLPALEKSPDELSNLGKLIISSLKAMLASGLGSHVQGQYKNIVESKPSNSETPFLCVLDEYGYYAVEGFAVVPAQARSLGFSVVFAGQDLPAFQKASKEEAASICANTNIKICMKLEDPQETWDFFNKTAGEATVALTRGFNNGQGVNLNYKDGGEVGFEKRARIDLMDLKDQREGQAHVFFKSEIVRANMYYANPKTADYINVNEFIPYPIISVSERRRLSYIKAFDTQAFIESIACVQLKQKRCANLEKLSKFIKSCNGSAKTIALKLSEYLIDHEELISQIIKEVEEEFDPERFIDGEVIDIEENIYSFYFASLQTGNSVQQAVDDAKAMAMILIGQLSLEI